MPAPSPYTGVHAVEFGKRVAVEVPAQNGVRANSTARVDAHIPINMDGYVDPDYIANAKRWNYVGAEAGITVNTPVALKAADADEIICLDEIEVINVHATQETYVEILDVAAVIWRFYIQAQDVPGLAVYRRQFRPPLKCAAINTALNIKAATAANLLVTARGHLETPAAEA